MASHMAWKRCGESNEESIDLDVPITGQGMDVGCARRVKLGEPDA